MDELRNVIRVIPDFPKKGIMFRDITTLLLDSNETKKAVDLLYGYAKGLGVNKVIGIEARGFILGALLADKLDAGFVPIRKPGKLPAATISETYELEYGTDKIEIHKDAIKPGDKVLVHDDLLATGGTAAAACKLVEKLGGTVVQVSFIVELAFLNGRGKLKGYDVKSLVIDDAE